MYIYLSKEDSAKLERLMREYEQIFHERCYAYCMSDPIAEIEKCLKTGKPYDPTTNPNFHPGADY